MKKIELYVHVTVGENRALRERHGPFTSEGFAYQFMCDRARLVEQGCNFELHGIADAIPRIIDRLETTRRCATDAILPEESPKVPKKGGK